MNLSLYIAKRYLISSSKNTAINIINRIAIFGIIAGSMALFVVLSVFSGLVDFSLSFVNSVDPDLKATPKTGKSFEISQSQLQQLDNVNGLASYSKIVEEQLLFNFKDKQTVAILKGVDSSYTKVSTIQDGFFNGDWFEDQTLQVVVGAVISQKLSMGLFDYVNKLEVYVPKAGTGAIDISSDFKTQILVPVGVYSVSEEVDAKYIFADYQLVQELLDLKPNQISSLEFKIDSAANEQLVTEQIQKILGSNVIIKNRMQLNETLYKMLNTENIAVYLIFTLVVIVALFNLIGALIMMIIEKKSNLKTLLNLGIPQNELRKIFLFQGTILSVVGGLFGLLLGVLIVFLQQKFQLIMITETLAYPVAFTFKNIAIVFLTVTILGVSASLLAANTVNKKLLA